MPAPLLPVPSRQGGDIAIVQMVALAVPPSAFCSLAEDSIAFVEARLCCVSVDVGRDSDMPASTYCYILNSVTMATVRRQPQPCRKAEVRTRPIILSSDFHLHNNR